jgi:solute carrier family 35 protein F5
VQDYLWLYSTLLTSPLVATLGLSLTIPLAILADAVFHEVHLNAMFVTGTTMVFAAFIGNDNILSGASGGRGGGGL